MPTATDLVTDLPADFAVFGQAVDTSMAGLLGGTTGQILSKTSGTNMAFTWVSPNPGDITGVTAGTGISGGGTSGDVTVTNSMATAITTSGDLVQGTGAGTFARLGTGTSGQYLTTNGTTNSWGTINAGGMTLLSTTNLSGTSTTISSINQTYTNLVIVLQNAYLNVAGNGRVLPNGSGGTAVLTQISGSVVTTVANITTVTDLPTATGNETHICQINNYADSTYKKTVIWYGSSTTAVAAAVLQAGIINDSNAITSITISTIAATSTFSGGRVLIYGVK